MSKKIAAAVATPAAAAPVELAPVVVAPVDASAAPVDASAALAARSVTLRKGGKFKVEFPAAMPATIYVGAGMGGHAATLAIGKGAAALLGVDYAKGAALTQDALRCAAFDHAGYAADLGYFFGSYVTGAAKRARGKLDKPEMFTIVAPQA